MIRVGRIPLTIGAALALSLTLVFAIGPRLSADVALPESCLKAGPVDESCVAQILTAYRADRVRHTETPTREDVLLRMSSRPIALRLVSSGLSHSHPVTVFLPNVAERWQVGLNAAVAPSSVPNIIVDLTFDRSGATSQDTSSMHLMIDPHDTPLPQRSVKRLGVQNYFLGRYIPTQVLSCKAERLDSDLLVAGAIAFAHLEGTSPDAASPLTRHDSDLLRACLFHALGTPALPQFSDDAQLETALRLAGAFRFCARSELGPDGQSLNAFDSPAGRTKLASCMTSASIE